MDAMPVVTFIDPANAFREFENSTTYRNLTSAKPNMYAEICQYRTLCHFDHIAFIFGNTLWIKPKYTAMDNPPAPRYATIDCEIYEIDKVSQFPLLRCHGHYFNNVFVICEPLQETDNGIPCAQSH
jgi:hypothetical protein